MFPISTQHKNREQDMFFMIKHEIIIIIILEDLHQSNIVNLDGTTLASSTTVRNLGVIFYQELSFNSR